MATLNTIRTNLEIVTKGRVQSTYGLLERVMEIEPDTTNKLGIQKQMDELINMAIVQLDDYYRLQWGATFTDRLGRPDKRYGIGLRPGDDGQGRAEYLVFLADHTEDPRMQVKLLESAARVYRAGGDMYMSANCILPGSVRRNHGLAERLYESSKSLTDRVDGIKATMGR